MIRGLPTVAAAVHSLRSGLMQLTHSRSKDMMRNLSFSLYRWFFGFFFLEILFLLKLARREGDGGEDGRGPVFSIFQRVFTSFFSFPPVLYHTSTTPSLFAFCFCAWLKSDKLNEACVPFLLFFLKIFFVNLIW